MRKKESELSSYVNGHVGFDFGKVCYGQVKVELDDIAQDLVEVVLAEYAENGRVVHFPGWRTFKLTTSASLPTRKSTVSTSRSTTAPANIIPRYVADACPAALGFSRFVGKQSFAASEEFFCGNPRHSAPLRSARRTRR